MHKPRPAPAVEQLALKSHIRDGDLTVESLTGKLGDSGLSVKLEIDAPPADPSRRSSCCQPPTWRTACGGSK